MKVKLGSSRLSALLRRLDRKLFGKRSASGIGVDSLIIIGFIVSFLMAFGGFIITGLGGLFGVIIDRLNLPALLVYIPGIYGQPLFEQTLRTAAFAPAEPTGIFTISMVMGTLYSVLRTVAFVIFIAAVVVMGITYVSEQFNLVSRGTALQVLIDSGFVLILIFLFPLIYNACAALLNAVNSNLILTAAIGGNKISANEMINETAKAATVFGGSAVTKWIPGLNIGGLILTLVQATATLAAVLTAFISGALRILLIGVFVSVFPIVLVFRLIPQLRGIAEQLQGALIGSLVASILVSVLFRVAWGVIKSMEGEDFMIWVVGCGTLIASASLMFIFTGGFARIARGVAGAITGPASGVMGGLIAAGAWGGMGFLTGAGAALGRGVAGVGGVGLAEAALRGGVAGAAVGMRGPLALPSAIKAGAKMPETMKEEQRIELAREIAETTGDIRGSPLPVIMAYAVRNPEFTRALKKLKSDAVVQRNIQDGYMLVDYWNRGVLSIDAKLGLMAAAYSLKEGVPLEDARAAMQKAYNERLITERQIDNSFNEFFAQMCESKDIGSDKAALFVAGLYNYDQTDGKKIFLSLLEKSRFVV